MIFCHYRPLWTIFWPVDCLRKISTLSRKISPFVRKISPLSKKNSPFKVADLLKPAWIVAFQLVDNSYKGIYKESTKKITNSRTHASAHTRERVRAQACGHERNTRKAIRPHRHHKVSPLMGGTYLASLAPQGRQAPLETALRRVFSPPEGGATPPLSKTALRVRFCPAHPPGGCRPPAKPVPPAGLSTKREDFSRSEGSVHGEDPKDEIFLRNG